MPYGLALLKEYEGDFYIAGTTYISNIDFGNGVELNPVGIAPFFVKFDSTGTAEWGEAGNASWCQAELQDLTVSNGKIAICGMFCEKFALGGDTLDYPMETNMYFASFFENGTLDTLFSVSSGTSGVFTMAYDHATNIATDVQGNVYFNAMFGDTMFFAADTILLDTTDVSSIFLSDDYMVGMFDSTFQPQWAYSLGNIIDFHGWGDLYSDELGNVFFVGVQLDSATKSVTGNSFVAKKGSPNVGLNDVERSGYALLKAYPNPVINSLSLELTDKYDKIISYEVYSIDGKRIFNGVANSTSILLDMTSYIDSYYIVRINTEKGLKYSAKILKNSNR
jgi:hypothetical protein